MAPSGNRRPGYSRKAQYGLFFGYVAAVTGAFIALLLLAAAIFDPQGFGALRGFVSDITAPASSSARGAARGVGSIGEQIGAYIDAGSKNRALNAEVEENRTRLVEARAIAYENARLKRMLRVVEQRPETVVAARLVSSSGSSSRRFAILNAGRGNGVTVGMPVRAPEGLIGRVEAVGGSTARITLLTDGGMVIPVRRADDGLPAISTGTGDGALDIRPLSTGANPFKLGDVLVTSGIGGVYAPNIPVAIITRVADDGATGVPLANPGRTDFAIVEPLFQPEAAAPGPTPPVAPFMPPTGLLMLLAWRLLRPELWPVWAALPFGLFDDLFSGQPLGSAMLSWTVAFIAIDLCDKWLVWRDYWQEWFIAASCIAFCMIAAFLIAISTGGGGYILIIVPLLFASILLFPLAARLCATLDRWRLMR